MADTPSQAQEPSMEEILASIRKIISEDGGTVEPVEPVADDVLELTQEMTQDTPSEPVLPPEVPVVEMEDTPPPPPVAVAAPPPAPVMMPEDTGRLVSDSAAQASAAALSGLTSMMRESHPVHGISSFPMGDGARTVESLVLELIRPYLKGWLDENLPALVERIVQKEIQKITRDMH